MNNKNFTIISNNCWGGFIYQMFGLKYNTPTIGLFIMERDYLKFCSDLEHYCNCELVFIKPEESKYYNELTDNGKNPITYPVARLLDIDVFFMHYKTEEEAYEKWTRRCKRINYSSLLLKMSQRNDCDESTVNNFLNIKHKNKICFTAEKFDLPCTVYVPELKDLNRYGGDETEATLKYVDIYKVLNDINIDKDM